MAFVRRQVGAAKGIRNPPELANAKCLLLHEEKFRTAKVQRFRENGPLEKGSPAGRPSPYGLVRQKAAKSAAKRPRCRGGETIAHVDRRSESDSKPANGIVRVRNLDEKHPKQIFWGLIWGLSAARSE
jgi:hypothetical protein